MRTSELLRIAWKTLRGRWAILPAMGVAIAAFALCFAGAVLVTVQQEKSQPYELVVTAQGDVQLSDSDVLAVSELENVEAATAVIEVPVKLTAEAYTADLTLTGIDAAYIDEAYAQGGVYPVDTVMPYIVLNDAARKAFIAEDDNSISDAPAIDWLNASFTVQLGEGLRPVIAKVCGVLAADEAEEAQEPAAYISLSSAKALQQLGQGAGYMCIRARVTDIGSAQLASREISTLELSVSNTVVELQARWDQRMEQMTYLIVIGIFALLCTTVLLAAWRTISRFIQHDAWETMSILGMTQRMQRRIFATQAGILVLVGAAIGITTSLSLPSFLATGEADTIFRLQPSALAVLVSAGVCLISGIAPAWLFLKEKRTRP